MPYLVSWLQVEAALGGERAAPTLAVPGALQDPTKGKGLDGGSKLTFQLDVTVAGLAADPSAWVSPGDSQEKETSGYSKLVGKALGEWLHTGR